MDANKLSSTNVAAGALRQLKRASSRVAGVKKAWAAWSDAARRVHFAAVMGYALPRNLGPSASWSIDESLAGDSELQDQLRASAIDAHHADALQGAIREHISWIMSEVRGGIERDVIEACSDPTNTLTLDSLDPKQAALQEQDAYASSKAAIKSLEHKLALAQSQVESLQDTLQKQGVSRAKQRAVDLHKEQLSFVSAKASELSFCDKALAEVSRKIAKKKEKWVGTASAFFTSTRYLALTQERKSVQAERAHIELDLQSYFDHHAHGATHSETVKPDRQALKLAPDLEKASAGFKQVQLVDMYCLSRGNEMWAIIADILRIGHDIDPIDCMHWQPPTDSSIDPCLAEYRQDQNRAFAQRLLSLVSPGLRSKLLARHKHGVSKREVKASEHDGCMIYWVMLQLYHPLSRDYRRTLELKINRYHSKFATGDPSIPLVDLQADIMEALDLMLRVRWDTSAIPIIDTLGARDALFQVELSKFRELPENPDDSAVELDQLCSHIDTVIQTLNTAKKNWDERTALAATASQNAELKSVKSELSKLKALISSGNTTALPNHNKNNPKDGYCQAQGCSNKIQGYTRENKWKLCSTCLLKCRTNGKPIKLSDGTLWGRQGSAHIAYNKCNASSVLGEMRAAGITGIPASRTEKMAKAAKAAKGLKRKNHVADPESLGQDGDAAHDNDAGDFSEGTQSFYKSLQAKRRQAKIAKLNKSN